MKLTALMRRMLNDEVIARTKLELLRRQLTTQIEEVQNALHELIKLQLQVETEIQLCEEEEDDEEENEQEKEVDEVKRRKKEHQNKAEDVTAREENLSTLSLTTQRQQKQQPHRLPSPSYTLSRNSTSDSGREEEGEEEEEEEAEEEGEEEKTTEEEEAITAAAAKELTMQTTPAPPPLHSDDKRIPDKSDELKQALKIVIEEIENMRHTLHELEKAHAQLTREIAAVQDVELWKKRVEDEVRVHLKRERQSSSSSSPPQPPSPHIVTSSADSTSLQTTLSQEETSLLSTSSTSTLHFATTKIRSVNSRLSTVLPANISASLFLNATAATPLSSIVLSDPQRIEYRKSIDASKLSFFEKLKFWQSSDSIPVGLVHTRLPAVSTASTSHASDNKPKPLSSTNERNTRSK
jgi:hypothetical protein